jgi:hypothetical protein
MNAIEKLILGFIFIFIGTGWMIYASKREKNRKAPGQIVIDFFTGSPIESVLIIGSILFGLIALVALFF